MCCVSKVELLKRGNDLHTLTNMFVFGLCLFLDYMLVFGLTHGRVVRVARANAIIVEIMFGVGDG